LVFKKSASFFSPKFCENCLTPWPNFHSTPYHQGILYKNTLCLHDSLNKILHDLSLYMYAF
jgi:hypothetical protein